MGGAGSSVADYTIAALLNSNLNLTCAMAGR
jgi:hypothetical protein